VLSEKTDHLQRITYEPEIPLAMYRELAAHLEQINNVHVDLLASESTEFSYLGSQVGGLRLGTATQCTPETQELIQEILAHYGKYISETIR
jgi:hypothetical protein